MVEKLTQHWSLKKSLEVDESVKCLFTCARQDQHDYNWKPHKSQPQACFLHSHHICNLQCLLNAISVKIVRYASSKVIMCCDNLGDKSPTLSMPFAQCILYRIASGIKFLSRDLVLNN